MIIEKFLQNFELLTDTQAGIKRLRQIVLKMANQGLIVSQDSGDGNAFQELALINKSEVGEPLIQDVVHLSSYPSNWTVASFPNIGKWMGGNGFPTSEQGHKTMEILFCKVSDMNLPINSRFILETTNTIDRQTAKRLRVNILPIGTVIFPKIGGAIATNKRRLICKPTVMDNNCMGLAPSSAIDSEWLFLLLSSIDMTHYQSGTSIPSLSQRVLDQIIFGIPPLKEQKRIVQKVNELFLLCDELEVAVDVRDRFARSARKSAVDGISTAQTPKELQGVWELIQKNWEVIAGTPESIESFKTLILDLAVRGDLVRIFYPDAVETIEWTTSELKLDDSKLWDLPTLHQEKRHGWNRIPLAKLGSWGSGGTPTSSRKDYYQNGTVPWAVIGDLNNDIMATTEANITEKALVESSSKLIPEGSILIAMYGASIGKTAITGVECCTNQAIAHCIVDTNLVSRDYFFIVAKSLKRHLIREGRGAAQPNISQAVLKHLIIDLPPLSEQELITKRVNALMKLCDELDYSLRQSEDLAEKFSRSVVSASA